jgi:hypothetical protein
MTKKDFFFQPTAIITVCPSQLMRQKFLTGESRVARWFVFKPKIQIWVKFGGSCTGRCWFILWTLGIVRGNLVYFSRFGILYEEKSGNPAGDQDGFRMWCNRRVACASGAEAAGSNPPEYKVEGLKIFFLILNFM